MAAQIIDQFRNSPRNVCYTCGSSQRDDDVVIDWGIEIVMEGFLQQCSTCIKDAAQQLGLMDEKTAGALRAQVLAAEAARVRAEKRAAAAETAIAALRELEDAAL